MRRSKRAHRAGVAPEADGTIGREKCKNEPGQAVPAPLAHRERLRGGGGDALRVVLWRSLASIIAHLPSPSICVILQYQR